MSPTGIEHDAKEHDQARWIRRLGLQVEDKEKRRVRDYLGSAVMEHNTILLYVR